MRIALLPSTQYGNMVVGGGCEAEYAQDIALRVKRLLNDSGVECESFAGSDDVNATGARQAVNYKPDVCLSIHTDAGGGVALGTLCCYQEEHAVRLGNVMLKVFCTEMGTTNRGFMKRTPGTNGVAVIRIPEQAGIKTVLLELLRHDVVETAQLLRDEGWRQTAAHALANGLIQYCGNVGIPQPKKEDEGMYEQVLNTKEFVRLDCWRDKFNYFVTTDGNAKNLRFRLDGKQGGTGTTDPQDKDGLVDHNLQDILKQERMKVVKGSYKLTVTSDKDINIGLREVAR